MVLLEILCRLLILKFPLAHHDTPAIFDTVLVSTKDRSLLHFCIDSALVDSLDSLTAGDEVRDDHEDG